MGCSLDAQSHVVWRFVDVLTFVRKLAHIAHHNIILDSFRSLAQFLLKHLTVELFELLAAGLDFVVAVGFTLLRFDLLAELFVDLRNNLQPLFQVLIVSRQFPSIAFGLMLLVGQLPIKRANLRTELVNVLRLGLLFSQGNLVFELLVLDLEGVEVRQVVLNVDAQRVEVNLKLKNLLVCPSQIFLESAVGHRERG